jgi:hypothetical protein
MTAATIHTLTLFGDGEANVRAFITKGGRDAALIEEALDRRKADIEINAHDDDEWPESRVRSEPAKFINESTYGDLDVRLDTITLES